jgi:hypothetical protein
VGQGEEAVGVSGFRLKAKKGVQFLAVSGQLIIRFPDFNDPYLSGLIGAGESLRLPKIILQ